MRLFSFFTGRGEEVQEKYFRIWSFCLRTKYLSFRAHDLAPTQRSPHIIWVQHMWLLPKSFTGLISHPSRNRGTRIVITRLKRTNHLFGDQRKPTCWSGNWFTRPCTKCDILPFPVCISNVRDTGLLSPLRDNLSLPSKVHQSRPAETVFRWSGKSRNQDYLTRPKDNLMPVHYVERWHQLCCPKANF